MSIRHGWVIFAFLVASTMSLADDLTGQDRILCTAVQATRCSIDEDCRSGPPWNWNIPQFIEIDLEKMQLSTTAASGQNRVTPIRNREHAAGRCNRAAKNTGTDPFTDFKTASRVCIEAREYLVRNEP